MFETFYGLRANPFAITPDPAFLFMSERHENALTMVEYALVQGSAISVISGDIGCGKTILTRRLIRLLDTSHTVGLINNTHPGMTGLVKWVARAFGLDIAGLDEADCYEKLEHFAIDQYAEGKSCLLIVDEAQNLAIKDLESLRILTNMNVDDDLVMQLILLGQPNLRNKLASPDLVQLVQRIGVEAELGPMALEDTVNYISHRTKIAGGRADLFDTFAAAGIHHFAGGVPRLVNKLCERSLVYGFSEGQEEIDLSTVMGVIHERDPVIRQNPTDAGGE